MALIGGGGAGNVAGGNPSGTGTGLTYVGDHCYAYSGSIAITSQVQTMLNFNTANNYLVVKIQTGVTQGGGGAQSDDIETVVQLNSEVIIARMLSHNNESGQLESIDLLIPPYSTILVTCDNVQGTTSTPTQVTLSGRVYG
jgi:hypothetical protein